MTGLGQLEPVAIRFMLESARQSGCFPPFNFKDLFKTLNCHNKITQILQLCHVGYWTGNSLKNIHSMSHEGTFHCNNYEIGINHEDPKFFLPSFAFPSLNKIDHNIT